MQTRFIYYIVFLMIGILSLINRDLTPVNELKYISISLESLTNHHLFTFYNHGEIYADKPPLYFWLIMLGIKVFGIQGGILFTGMFSLLSMVGICEILIRWIGDEFTTEMKLTSILMLLTSALFFVSGLILRMDMLMAFFICLSLFTFYQTYTLDLENKPLGTKPYFILVYIWLATMVKGPVGLMLPVLSICIFLISKRKFRQLFKFFPFKAIAIFVAMMALWFIAIYIEGGKDYLYALTLEQAQKRGIDASIHPEPIYYYVKVALIGLLPWTLLVISGWVSTWKMKQDITEKQIFFLIISLTGFIMLSAVSSKLEIYFLPVLPFMLISGMFGLNKAKDHLYWQWGMYPIVISAVILPLITGIGSLFFLNQIKELPIQVKDIYLLLLVILAFGVLTFIQMNRLKFYSACRVMSFGILALLFTITVKIPQYNQLLGHQELAQKAQLQYEKNGRVGYYEYKHAAAQNMDVYLGQSVQDIENLEVLNQLATGSVIITKRKSDELFKALDMYQITPQYTLKMGKMYLVVI